MLTASVSGAYWYNPKVGTIRARVSDQGSQAATLAFYNLVNGSQETKLGNPSGGGGGGGGS